MTVTDVSEAAKAVVRRNTEEVQGGGDYQLYDELFADDFVDHTPQPGRTSDKAGALELYKVLRAAFPDFHAVIHWQAADGNLVTTYKTYHGTHEGSSSESPPPARRSSSRPSTRCAWSTGGSPSTGAWPTSSPSWSSWEPGPAADEPRISSAPAPRPAPTGPPGPGSRTAASSGSG